MKAVRKTIKIATLSAALALALSLCVHPAAAQKIVASIDTSQTAAPVSNYIFGMFIEHIGKTMYGPLWAEMIDDRKFYLPIVSKDPETQERRGFPGMELRKWRPVGGDDVVTMDKEKPFVGEQSPRIALDAKAQHGIRQSGIALVKGKRYTGRIVVKASPGTHIAVSLLWGQGTSERQAIALAPLAETYKTIPLSFVAQADASDGAIEITGTGSGSFHLGAISLMPADNIHGFRPDTIALLKEIKSGFWRFGGNYTSNYTWYNAIGDRDQRPPEWDYAWNQMQTNDLGMDEFAEFCKLIGVEPYISVNAGLGDAHSAAEQVEYMNGPVSTHMGALRAKNGHAEPYRVKLWNIGNEPWGPWQVGRTDTQYFMQKHNDFAKAMRKVDPSIVLIASGEMLEDGNVPGPKRAQNIGNLGPLYSTDADWTGSFLKSCMGNFDGMAEHWYASPGVHFDLEKAKTLPSDANSDQANVKVPQTLQEFARYPANIVRVKAEEWQGYMQRYPAISTKKIFLSIDEWAYFGGDFGRSPSLKQALAYGMVFNEMLRHSDSLTMAAHTMGTSTLDFNQTASTLNGLGLVFKMYSNTFSGTVPVAVGGNAPQPEPKYPVGGDQPRQNSGSPTYPLDVYAALSPDRRTLHVAVVNATESAQTLDLELAAVHAAGPVKILRLEGAGLSAANHVGKPAELAARETTASEPIAATTVPPISVSIFSIPLAP
ncbi:MAG: alpha-N-arabinofuranosidase [Terracidiphilus sp.]|nr:alpha-N-arabinofuranosidase [Terracidiphilus sp.]